MVNFLRYNRIGTKNQIATVIANNWNKPKFEMSILWMFTTKKRMEPIKVNAEKNATTPMLSSFSGTNFGFRGGGFFFLLSK
jgi:hypothetical protein